MKFSENSIVLQISLIPGSPSSASVSDLMIPHALEPLGAPPDSVVGMRVEGKRRRRVPRGTVYSHRTQKGCTHCTGEQRTALLRSGPGHGHLLTMGHFLPGRKTLSLISASLLSLCSGLFLQFTDSFSHFSLFS